MSYVLYVLLHFSFARTCDRHDDVRDFFVLWTCMWLAQDNEQSC
uniref:Uncharacterized protein n=1 Tax=Arundo donax TaxID=35708 RepID=A0A0A9CDM6_ARUDO